MSQSFWLTLRNLPSRLMCDMPTAACSNVARKRSSVSRKASSAFCCSLASSNCTRLLIVKFCVARQSQRLRQKRRQHYSRCERTRPLTYASYKSSGGVRPDERNDSLPTLQRKIIPFVSPSQL